MKRKIKEPAILFRITNYSETSLILQVLGKDSGVISIIAKGIRNKPLCNTLSVLNEYEFSLYEPAETGLYLFSEACCLQEYITSDNAARMAAALAGVEFVSQLMVSKDEHEAYYDLICKYLSHLQKVEKNHVAIFWRLIIRVFVYLGIELDVSVCNRCKTRPVSSYDRNSLELLCGGCFDASIPSTLRVDFSSEAAELLAMLPGIGNHLEQISLSRGTVSELNTFFLQYFHHHLHKALSLKSLKVLEQYY